MASGWSASVSGISQVQNALNQLSTEWSGDTVYLVGPAVQYAIHHEFGTTDIPARPFMRPAVERVMSDPLAYAQQYVGTVSGEHDLIRGVALAIETEARRIADRKDIRDTGQLISSIKAERIQ